jgi:hypothetical protein
LLHRFLAVVVFGLLLSGCVTATNTLTSDQVSNFRLQSVVVRYRPDVFIWWGDGERAFAAMKGAPVLTAETVADTDEGRAYMRAAITAKLAAAMEQALKPELVGPRPVRIEIEVKRLQIASAVQRVLVGGHHNLSADVNVVDAKTGALLLAFSDQNATAMAGQGWTGALIDAAFLGDPIDRVMQNYALQYRNWLLRK